MSERGSEAGGEAPRPGLPASLARPGGISYLEIPATDVTEAAVFYEHVFGWTIREPESARPSFDDGTGHVSGAWKSELEVSRVPGHLPYVYADDVDAVVRRAIDHGGDVVREPYPEGNLRVATVRDPSGNVIGVWQEVGAAG